MAAQAQKPRRISDDRVLPGEILVAPHTDTGWTPCFLPAAGIVVHMGGLLSHGGICTREYGKPAVVNVGPPLRRRSKPDRWSKSTASTGWCAY